MNSLPLELENIIMDYKYQLDKSETIDKYNKCIEELYNTMGYYCGTSFLSVRTMKKNNFIYSVSCIEQNKKIMIGRTSQRKPFGTVTELN